MESPEISIADPYATSGDDDPDYVIENENTKVSKRQKSLNVYFNSKHNNMLAGPEIAEQNSSEASSAGPCRGDDIDEISIKLQRNSILDGIFF